MNIKQLQALILAAMLSACSTLDVQKGAWTFHKTTFGTDIGFQELDITQEGPDTIKVRVKGLESDQSQAIRAAVEGAVQGVVAGVKP